LIKLFKFNQKYPNICKDEILWMFTFLWHNPGKSNVTDRYRGELSQLQAINFLPQYTPEFISLNHRT
jgi:hypothetical protein